MPETPHLRLNLLFRHSIAAIYTMAFSFALSFPSIASIHPTYDALNRLDRLTDPAGSIITYTYDANGNLKTVSLPNGIRSDYSVDARNRLTKLEHRRASDNSLLGTVAYTLTANNLRSQTAETFSIGGMAYGAGPVTNYTYDANGNTIHVDATAGNSSTATDITLMIKKCSSTDVHRFK